VKNYIGLTIVALTFGSFVVFQSAPAAFVFATAMVGLIVAEYFDLEAAKITKPSKSLEELQALAERTATELSEIKNKVSGLSVAQAARPPFPIQRR
jgi:L-cystine uptake protein TcyP (sodium:dicarboxylate symporter family)